MSIIKKLVRYVRGNIWRSHVYKNDFVSGSENNIKNLKISLAILRKYETSLVNLDFDMLSDYAIPSEHGSLIELTDSIWAIINGENDRGHFIYKSRRVTERKVELVDYLDINISNNTTDFAKVVSTLDSLIARIDIMATPKNRRSYVNRTLASEVREVGHVVELIGSLAFGFVND